MGEGKEMRSWARLESSLPLATMSARNSMQIAAPLVPTSSSSLAALADPPNRLVDAAVMDYFLIELVNTLRVSAAVATARSKKIEQEMIEAGLIPPPPAPAALTLSSKKDSARDSVTSLNSRTGKSAVVDEEEEAVRTRLEAIGLHVGANFTERCVPFISGGGSFSLDLFRLSRDRPPFSETLDAIKFVCKDIWAACWEKQVDNLRTNHRV